MDAVQNRVSRAGERIVENLGNPEFVHLVRAPGLKQALNDFDRRRKEYRGGAGEQAQYNR